MRRLNASNLSSKNPAAYTKTTAAQEPADYRTSAARKAAIQTTEGSYEAELIESNSNNCPIQKNLNLIRYRISRPPRMMRNIPKYHATKKLQNQEVLKFDIRNPDPVRQMWNRRGENSEHADQECIIETTEQIQEKENNHSGRTQRKEHIRKKRAVGIISKEHARTLNTVREGTPPERGTHTFAPDQE